MVTPGDAIESPPGVNLERRTADVAASAWLPSVRVSVLERSA